MQLKQGPKLTKPVPEHIDRLGRPIQVGSYVAVGIHNGIMIGQVTKLNPKMIKVAQVPTTKRGYETNKYPYDMVVLDSDEMVFYILKNTGV
jgi:hypothetical protein